MAAGEAADARGDLRADTPQRPLQFVLHCRCYRSRRESRRRQTLRCFFLRPKANETANCVFASLLHSLLLAASATVERREAGMGDFRPW